MEDSTPVSSFPGINRIQYFLITLVFGFFWGFSVGLTGADSTVTNVINLVAIVGIFIATVFRLHSIGISRWFAIISLVPVANIIFGIFTQSAQPGWFLTRRFDRAGKIVGGVILDLYLLVFLVALMFTFFPRLVIK